MTVADLARVIARMSEADARGNRLIHRILTEQHRDFDPDPLGDWHRSQVRKDVATSLRDELSEQTGIYSEISSAFTLVQGCDSIRCKIERSE
jgi:hypothetical protein